LPTLLTHPTDYHRGALSGRRRRRSVVAARGRQAQACARPNDCHRNQTGASGNIGTESVFRSPHDGYTLLTAPQLTFSVNNMLNPSLRFDSRALEPVSVLATYPFVLFGRADLPVNSLAELIAYAKANPGKLSYASQGGANWAISQ